MKGSVKRHKQKKYKKEKQKMKRNIARMKKIKEKLNSTSIFTHDVNLAGEFLRIESSDHMMKRSFVTSKVSKSNLEPS